MRFIGTVGQSATVSSLTAASAANMGHTYKVITNGTYGGVTCEEGDILISNGTEWILIPSGDEPSGTVTSIATGSGLTGGTITSSGTISLATAYGDTVNPYGTKNKNLVLASSSTANNKVPLFRSLVSDDIPTLSITDKTSGILPISRGGTNAATALNAITNLGGAYIGLAGTILNTNDNIDTLSYGTYISSDFATTKLLQGT